MSVKLSSDILEEQFGATAVDVLFQDETKRIIQTRSLKDGRILEISYVQFDPAGTNVFPAVHTKVRAGESMGKAFSQLTIPFVRDTSAVFRSHVSHVFQAKFQSQEMPLLTNTTILVGSEHVRYATILEMYHPEVRWPDAEKGHAWSSAQVLAEFEQLLLTATHDKTS